MSYNDEISNLSYELRKALEQRDEGDCLTQKKIADIEKQLDALETKNQELVAKIATEQKTNEELKEQYEVVEKKLLRSKVTGAYSVEKSEEHKAFENYLRFGHPEGKEAVSGSLNRKYLRTDNNANGGYLAPDDYANEIIKKITEISPIRQVARVRSTTLGTLSIPKRDTLVSGYWVGEGASINESESTYGLESVKVNKVAVCSISTTEMLMDSAFNIEAEINNDITERFAQVEGAAFVNGNGVEKPEGFMFNSDVTSIDSGVSNDISAESLMTLTGELKAGYNPYFILNRKTLAKIRTLQDGGNQYVWAAGLGDSIPNTILGFPYLIAADMPDIEANAFPIVFGDLLRGYTIVDHNSLSVLRDDYTLARQGKVQFVAHRRVGGQVVLAEAFKKLKVAS